MKLVWSPETATKAYIDTVNSCEIHKESSVAELISAMAAGWHAKFIVETWLQGGVVTTSVGLAIANRHTGGRHVCIVENEDAKTEYIKSMSEAGVCPEVVVGDAETVMSELDGIDFMVVDGGGKDCRKMMRLAKLGHRGAVLICKNASSSGFKWKNVIEGVRGARLVRVAFLPVGKGLDIAYVATSCSGTAAEGKTARRRRRWITHIDQNSGEEHVIIRRC